MGIARTLAALAALGSAACSPIDALNLLASAPEYRAARGLAYGPDPRQTLDVYTPAADTPSAGCRIVFAYGGSWREGRKEHYAFVGAALAKRGYTVFIPDYRLYPDVRYPAFVEDLAASVAHPALDNYGDGPLVLAGHSAGAFNAAHLAYNGRYRRPDVAAFVSLAGPHDHFLPTDNPRWSAIFGRDKAQQRQALPVAHVDASAPPTLIMHGREDSLVTPRAAQSLSSRLEAAGVRHQTVYYPDTGHRKLAAALAPLPFMPPVVEEIDRFLQDGICHKQAGTAKSE